MAIRAPGISARPSAWAASRNPSSVSAEAPSASPQIASGAMPTPPPARIGRPAAAAAGVDGPAPGARAGEAAAERAEQVEAVARAELGEPVGAGPDVLEQEVELAVAASHHGERPRQERALVDAAAPAMRRREHVELAGIGRRAVVGHGQNRVRPVLPAFDDARKAATERREGPRGAV